MNNFSVLLLDGEGDISLFVARCLGQIRGVKVHALSQDKWTPLRFSRHFSTFQLTQKANDEQRLADISAAIKQTGCDIVLPIAEPAVRFIATHKFQLSKLTQIPPIPLVNMFDTTVDKGLLMAFLTKHQIPCPQTAFYTNDNTFKQQLSKLTFPVLIKPIRGSDGKGIQFFQSEDSLLEHLGQKETFVNQYIVQDFVDGYDIDCNVLCQDGKILAHTIQKGFIFRARRFAPPAGIQFVRDEQIFDVVSRWAAATQWSGVAHLDLRYDKHDRQTKIIEVNARYWGSLLGSLVAGVNFPYLACLAGLGIPFAKPNYELKNFVSGNAAIKRGWQQLAGRVEKNLTFSETSWRYAIDDPIAEMFKIGRQLWKP
ncbi:MAG: ATP-grasp domain-containing protein [Chloroflexi bacterium]|nr:ATP-grasp domain-containing protein [Chloroflexota bacterium]